MAGPCVTFQGSAKLFPKAVVSSCAPTCRREGACRPSAPTAPRCGQSCSFSCSEVWRVLAPAVADGREQLSTRFLAGVYLG